MDDETLMSVASQHTKIRTSYESFDVSDLPRFILSEKVNFLLCGEILISEISFTSLHQSSSRFSRLVGNERLEIELK